MSWPVEVVEFLENEFRDSTKPFCILINGDGHLVDQWGDAQWCEHEDLEIGDDVLERDPFLHGCLDQTSLRLDFVSLKPGLVAHVRILPAQRGHYAILLDAREEHDSIRQKQQTANELKLLHIGQRKLIARQRDLIAGLVEARAELDHRRKEAERVSRSRGRFIAMMSHEFRTPIASIVNYSDLALGAGVSSEELVKSVEAISRSGRHLASLVDAVLDEARLDAGQAALNDSDFDLYALLDDLTGMMAPLAAEKGLAFATRVDPDVPEFMHADHTRLRQILINLLGNAVKFTEQGGVELAVSFSNEHLAAVVHDTGPGIDLKDQERVFTAFERGTGSDDRAAGVGLGLTISMQLATLMGGDVSLDSAAGKGCTVSVHVPVSSPVGRSQSDSTAFGAAPSEETAAEKATSVLLCDDDEDMIALVEHYLLRAGYGLMTAGDGEEAIEKALSFSPDLVLLDVNIPGMSGIDAAGQLRDRGYGGPIVALTASRLSRDEEGAFTRCFRKPAPMSELLADIKRLTH